MSDEEKEVMKEAKPTRRAMVNRTLIGLGAATLLQPKGGVAQGSSQPADKKTDEKKSRKTAGKPLEKKSTAVPKKG